MNIRIRPEKKRYFFYALLIALLAAAGSGLSLYQASFLQDKRDPEYSTAVSRLFHVFCKALVQENDFQLLGQIAAIAVFLMFLVVFSYRYTKKEVISSALLAALFGLCIWTGTVFSENESWNYFFQNKYADALNIAFMLGYALIMFGILLCLCKIVKKSPAFYRTGDKKTARSAEEGQDVSAEADTCRRKYKKVFFCCAGVIILCWLPYYAAFWPGLQHGDLPMQILQYFHYPTRFQGRWVSDGVDIIYTNDHPFFHTQLVGLFLSVGMKMNNVNLGYAAYTALQAVGYALAFSGLITTLYYLNVNTFYLKILTGIYALVPVFPDYALLIGGDSFFAFFFLLYMILLLWMFGTHGEILKKKRFLFVAALEIFFLSASKSQGMYVAAVMFLFCFFYFRKNRLRILVAMLIPLLVFQVGYKGFFFEKMHIADAGKQEALSVCFQQTARYVKYHGEEVTQKEKEAINAVLKYRKIADKYDPQLSDPVKSTYRKDASAEKLKAYFAVWFEMGVKHPGEYIQSFLANTFGYYYPMFYTQTGIYDNKGNPMKAYIKRRPWVQESPEIQSFLKKVEAEPPENLQPFRKCVRSFTGVLRRMPVIKWLFCAGSVSWLMLLAFFALFISKNYRAMLAFLPVFLIFGVCLLSPKNNNLRYIYPACCMVPAMLSAAFGGIKFRTTERMPRTETETGGRKRRYTERGILKKDVNKKK